MNAPDNEQQMESTLLVSCIEKPCIDDAATGEGTAALLERVRTKLTVVRGFSQLLRRRLRRQDPATDLHELDRIGDAVTELDELLYRYERASRR